LILSVFRIRSFRFQMPADLLTSWAFEMETLILGWYVMVNTGSVLLLTAFASLQYVGSLAAPMFGVLGDRLGGRPHQHGPVQRDAQRRSHRCEHRRNRTSPTHHTGRDDMSLAKLEDRPNERSADAQWVS
jgi:hypothetical protein